MPTALEQRFLNFLSTVPGSESLDDLLCGEAYSGQRRADYLLFDRSVIVEVKSLETDTSPKVEAEMGHHRERDEFPIIYGKVELTKVLKHLPDGEEINKQIFYRTTRSVEDATRSAEAQISNTARILGLTKSVGIMVLLNEGIDFLTPEVVAARVLMLMRRKAKDGTDRSPIAYSWMLFESHTLASGPAEKTFPMIVLEGPLAPKYEWFSELLTYLQISWAQFNGHPLVLAESNDLSKLQMKSSSSSSPKLGGKITRQQIWELQYKEKPYLRALSDSEVLQHGRATVENLTSYFLVGGPKTPPEQMEKLMSKWSDFLCEARHRGLDLRHMRERA